MMERQLGQMVRLVDDLLDVSRITRGKIELRKERVRTGGGRAAAPWKPAARSSSSMGHELTVTLPPQPVFVDADLTRLAQVFCNLLNNAAKYTERGGHIWLTAERQGSDVVVSVQGHRHRHPRRHAAPHLRHVLAGRTGRWSGRRAGWASA